MLKHILNQKVHESTSIELLMVLLHTNGIGPGPVKVAYAQPVLETLIEIGPDMTAKIIVYEEDMEVIKALFGEVTDEELLLYGKGEPKTLEELRDCSTT